jgi:ABC-type dipeptide/oligopeptide/nickel transport system permease component
MITISRGRLRRLLGGATLIEVVCMVPGSDDLPVESVARHSVNTAQVVGLFAAIRAVIVPLIGDLLYAWLKARP